MYLQQLTLALLLLLCCSLACEFWSDDPEWYFNEEPPINGPDLLLLPKKLISFNDLVDKEHWVTFLTHWKVNRPESYSELASDSSEWLLVDDPEFFNDPVQDDLLRGGRPEPHARRLLQPRKAKPHADSTQLYTNQKNEEPDACIAVKDMIPVDLFKSWKT